MSDVHAATAAACAAYREQHSIPEGVQLPDDALSFQAGDEEIIISFTVELQDVAT